MLGDDLTCTATYAMDLGVTEVIPIRLATCPLVGARLIRRFFKGRKAGSSRSFSVSMLWAEVGEVMRNLNV